MHFSAFLLLVMKKSSHHDILQLEICVFSYPCCSQAFHFIQALAFAKYYNPVQFRVSVFYSNDDLDENSINSFPQVIGFGWSNQDENLRTRFKSSSGLVSQISATWVNFLRIPVHFQSTENINFVNIIDRKVRFFSLNVEKLDKQKLFWTFFSISNRFHAIQEKPVFG